MKSTLKPPGSKPLKLKHGKPLSSFAFKFNLRRYIKVYYPCEVPFALLYFTGSDYFNRSMRRFATDKHQWSLNDKGCFKQKSNPASRIQGYAARPCNRSPFFGG